MVQVELNRISRPEKLHKPVRALAMFAFALTYLVSACGPQNQTALTPYITVSPSPASTLTAEAPQCLRNFIAAKENFETGKSQLVLLPLKRSGESWKITGVIRPRNEFQDTTQKADHLSVKLGDCPTVIFSTPEENGTSKIFEWQANNHHQNLKKIKEIPGKITDLEAYEFNSHIIYIGNRNRVYSWDQSLNSDLEEFTNGLQVDSNHGYLGWGTNSSLHIDDILTSDFFSFDISDISGNLTICQDGWYVQSNNEIYNLTPLKESPTRLVAHGQNLACGPDGNLIIEEREDLFMFNPKNNTSINLTAQLQNIYTNPDSTFP
ncbi:hypothetical protein A2W14_03540 [Candidatus Gottesmanbacteria bacterium RBG_16_37_8]|uniref:Uncharacterized protein n=1 Tax=Candidatus Gottesmanbacteria bacterium RBG_16_37_8 TaxID=1798371 RepID=A0A1F5YSH3_9BACT|nr:MAG: hypothetical protein A2W14_03540 [Candidatus Gottesmanbacteria bacterium RBG_16_37_8]